MYSIAASLQLDILSSSVLLYVLQTTDVRAVAVTMKAPCNTIQELQRLLPILYSGAGIIEEYLPLLVVL